MATKQDGQGWVYAKGLEAELKAFKDKLAAAERDLAAMERDLLLAHQDLAKLSDELAAARTALERLGRAVTMGKPEDIKASLLRARDALKGASDPSLSGK